ncbi:UDP-glucuronate 4-epimerase 4 [Tanacetum coccineum]
MNEGNEEVGGIKGSYQRQAFLERSEIYIVEGDINDVELVKKLFKVVWFSHVMHLAGQAGVRYAMKNNGSYVRSTIGFGISF